MSHFHKRLVGITFGLARLQTKVLPWPRDNIKDLQSMISVFDSHTKLPAEVKGFLAERAEYSLQLGGSWFENLEKTVFTDDRSVRYFVLWRLNIPIAVLPLLMSKARYGTRATSLGNYYTALYAPALAPWIKAQDLRPLIDAIRSHVASLTSLTLLPMDPDGFEFKTMRAALATPGLVPFSFFCFGNWYLKPPPDWASYLASRDGKVRSTLKRMTQRLTNEGGRVEVMSAPDDVDRGHAIYKQVYDKSWKVPEPYPNFIIGLMQLCASAGALRLGIVWIKDAPIAAQIWIVTNGRAEIYKVAYDEGYKSLSPGTVLTAHLIRHAIEIDKVQEVDYLIGDDAYKAQWMDARRERWGLVAYNIRSVMGFIGCVAEASGRFVKSIRRWWSLRTKSNP